MNIIDLIQGYGSEVLLAPVYEPTAMSATDQEALERICGITDTELERVFLGQEAIGNILANSLGSDIECPSQADLQNTAWAIHFLSQVAQGLHGLRSDCEHRLNMARLAESQEKSGRAPQ